MEREFFAWLAAFCRDVSGGDEVKIVEMGEIFACVVQLELGSTRVFHHYPPIASSIASNIFQLPEQKNAGKSRF